MKLAIRLARVSGINIYLHWTFFFIILWILFYSSQQNASSQETLYTLGLLLAIYVCVVLHELGHALTAKRYGIHTKDITLYPIGGVANLERIPENPKQEFFVAIAGPLVNVAISVVLLLVYLGILQHDLYKQLFAERYEPGNFVLDLMIMNILLVVFNIIPAFPMDGGRILRSLLAMKLNRVTATRIAAMFGKFFAVIFTIVGIYYNPFLILIGIFVYFGASYEYKYVESQALFKGFKVLDAMRTKYSVLQAGQNMEDAVKELMAGADKNFVVLEDGKVAGILKQNDIIKAIGDHKEETPVSEYINRDFPVINTSQDIGDVFSLMQTGKHDVLPVFENGRFAGIIDTDNITEFLLIQGAVKKYGE